MTRDYGTEIDQLRAEVEALKQRLAAAPRRVERTSRPGIDPNFPQAANTVSYSGYHDNGVSEGAQWQAANVEIAALLGMDDNRTTRILSALGSKERFAILKQILQHPMTASELVEALNLGTTGKAYHHLNALQAADFVTNVNGRFHFQGYRVPGFIMILAGIGDLVDETLGKGNMDEL